MIFRLTQRLRTRPQKEDGSSHPVVNLDGREAKMQQGGFESYLCAIGTSEENSGRAEVRGSWDGSGERGRDGGGGLEKTQKVLRRLPVEDREECTLAFLTRTPRCGGLKGRGGREGGVVAVVGWRGPGPETGQNLGSTIRHGEAELTAEEFHMADVRGGGG